jgi:hypothetical protein
VTTYEDLFFLCDQIFYWANGLADHAQTTAFMEAIEQRAGDLLVGATHERRMFDLGKLGRPGRELIESTVAAVLNRRYLDGFDLLHELARDGDVDELNIVTLNHDTLVEQFFGERGVEYVDGFGEPDGDIRWSDDKVYDRTDVRVRLFKLHGSIDWYSIQHSGFARTVVLVGDDFASARDRTGAQLRPALSGPSFLTGINKDTMYNGRVYSDVHLRFQSLLRQTDRIIMSGYGWGDSAINLQPSTWLDRSPSHKLILLHRYPKELIKKSLIMATGFDAWVRLGRVALIERWMSEVTFPEIRAELD